MQRLLDNPAFVTALIALIGALTAWVQQRVSQERQGVRLDALKERVDGQAANRVRVVPLERPPPPLADPPAPSPPPPGEGAKPHLGAG